MNTDHKPLIDFIGRLVAWKTLRKFPSHRPRYDLGAESPEYVEELVTHHVGGYPKIAPEHTEDAPLTKMMKPGIGSYDRFKQMFDAAAAKAGKKYFLIPYFIAAHPGCRDEDMMNLALWLKRNGYRADQVQTFTPTPMSLATAMYYSERNPLKPVRRLDEDRGFDSQHHETTSLAQGLSSLSRSSQLAIAPRCVDEHGAQRPHWEWQASLAPAGNPKVRALETRS